MKKLFLLLVIFIPVALFAQSKTLELLNKEGTLLTKDFKDLGKVGSLNFESLKITDVLTDSTTVALKVISTNYDINGIDKYTGVIDEDELDKTKNVLSYICGLMERPAPDEHPDITYSTRDGILIRAYIGKYLSGPNAGKSYWSMFIQTRKNTDASKVNIQKEEALREIIEIFDRL